MTTLKNKAQETDSKSDIQQKIVASNHFEMNAIRYQTACVRQIENASYLQMLPKHIVGKVSEFTGRKERNLFYFDLNLKALLIPFASVLASHVLMVIIIVVVVVRLFVVANTKKKNH